MLQKIPVRLAANLIIIILAAAIVFHILVVAGLIPFHIVGGGRLETRQEMLQAETAALLANAFMLAVVAVWAGHIPVRPPKGLLRAVLLLMAVLFALNTVGNLFARHWLETAIFTPVTLVLALLTLRLLLDRPIRLRKPRSLTE